MAHPDVRSKTALLHFLTSAIVLMVVSTAGAAVVAFPLRAWLE